MGLPELALLLEHLNESPVTAKDIASWTRRDPLLSIVAQCVCHGWPTKENKKSRSRPFFGKEKRVVCTQ